MSKQLYKYLALILIPIALAACGGGGGGEGGGPTATVKISLNRTQPDNTPILGAEFILTLPANVTPATTSGVINNGVVTPSGTFAGGTLFPPLYTPATSTTAGTIQVVLANGNPAGVTQVGEIATVTLQLANGATPTIADFALNLVNVSPVTSMGKVAAVISGVQLQ